MIIALAVLAAAAAAPPVHTCINPVAIDGDTIKCGRAARRINIRLLGIDSPELAGHCARGRTCAPGDPLAAKAALAALLTSGKVTWQAFHIDRYRRPDAIVRVGRINASCTLMAAGHALFKPQWDAGGRIDRECFASQAAPATQPNRRDAK